MNVADLVRRQAELQPHAIAFVEGRESVDWATLAHRISTTAWHLQERGVRRGDVVALAIRNSIVHLVQALALSTLGAPWCSLDWRPPAAHRKRLLRIISASFLIEDRPSESEHEIRVIMPSPSWRILPSDACLPAAVDPGDLPAFLLQTSGTTGMPKAMTISHEAVLQRARIRARTFGLQQGMRIMHAMPLWATAPINGVFGQLWIGARGYFHPILSSADELLDQLRLHRIQQVALSPTTIRDLTACAGAGEALRHMQALIAVGAAFPQQEKMAAMATLTPHLWEGYGSAGIGQIAVASPDDLRRHPSSVGRAPEDVDLEIVDDENRPAPTGTVGRIRARSLGAASGYVGSSGDDDSREGFSKGWVFTGDLGRLDDDGYLFLVGRSSNLIIRGGQNMSAEEIEDVLISHPDVREAAVLGRNDARLGQVPVALVVTRRSIAAGELIGFCRSRLPAAKVPVEVRLVESLPRTSTGKIQRRDLADLLLKTDPSA